MIAVDLSCARQEKCFIDIVGFRKFEEEKNSRSFAIEGIVGNAEKVMAFCGVSYRATKEFTFHKTSSRSASEIASKLFPLFQMDGGNKGLTLQAIVSWPAFSDVCRAKRDEFCLGNIARPWRILACE